MEQKKSHSLSLLKPVKTLFRRFHLTLFFVLIIGCLSGAVLLMSDILQNTSADPNYTSSINAGTIDEATLNRLNDLHTSPQGAAPPTLPAGRVNPFGE